MTTPAPTLTREEIEVLRHSMASERQHFENWWNHHGIHRQGLTPEMVASYRAVALTAWSVALEWAESIVLRATEPSGGQDSQTEAQAK